MRLAVSDELQKNLPIEFCLVKFISRSSVSSRTIPKKGGVPLSLQLCTPPLRNGKPVRSQYLIDEYEAALPSGGGPFCVLGNHHRPRLATRIGSDQARVAAMLPMTLRGTPPLR